MTVQATVRDEMVEANGQRISANHFGVSIKEVSGMTSERLIQLAKAKAMNIETGEEVAITKVTHALKADKGNYDVTFETEVGTAITVRTTVRDTGVESEFGELMYANYFTLPVEQSNNLTNEKLIELAGAVAENIETGANVEISNVVNGIQSTKGIYDVTFKTEVGSSITVQATITNTINGVPDDSKTRKDVSEDSNGTRNDTTNTPQENAEDTDLLVNKGISRNYKDSNLDVSTRSTIGYIDIVVLLGAIGYAWYIFKKKDEMYMTRKQEQRVQWGVAGIAGVTVVLFIEWMCFHIPFRFGFIGTLSWVYISLVVAEVAYVYIYKGIVRGRFKNKSLINK